MTLHNSNSYLFITGRGKPCVDYARTVLQHFVVTEPMMLSAGDQFGRRCLGGKLSAKANLKVSFGREQELTMLNIKFRGDK